MKKRLEAELISIAHRVLKLKNKSEVDQLFSETQKLYEALSVLKFYGDYIEQVPQAEVGQEELEEKLAESLEGKAAPKLDVAIQQEVAKEKKQIVPVDEESEAGEEAQADEVVEEAQPAEEEKVVVGEINVEDEEAEATDETEEEEEESGSDPLFEMASEEIKQESVPESPSKQITFEDFLGDFKEVEFVKPNDVSTPKNEPEKDPQTEKEPEVKEPEPSEPKIKEPKEEPAKQTGQARILNETRGGTSNSELAKQAERSEAKLAPGINIGLNDRVGFVKYLFDNSSEDFNRVLSQLNTFDSYAEAREFIDDMVKPDYNNWKGQEDFSERFMEIVEQKFR